MRLAKMIGVCAALLTLATGLIEPASAYDRTEVRLQTRGHHARVYNPIVRTQRSRRVNRSWRANNRRRNKIHHNRGHHDDHGYR